LDILLSLAFGELLDASLSTARCAAVADFMRAHLSGSATPEELADLEQFGNIATNIAHDAFGLGEWNDYSDRRELIHGLVDAPAEELTELLRRSVEGADTCPVYGVEHNLPEIDPNVQARLMEELMAQMTGWNPSVNDGEDQEPESS
jgi:hypothetical protein